jgi:hypothetical protein
MFHFEPIVQWEIPTVMEDLEGDAAAAPRRPFLAYAEVAGEDDDLRGSALRRDSADGDIVESTVKADMRALQRRLNAREAESAQVRSDALQLRNELEAARAEVAALKDATLRKEHPPPTSSPAMQGASGSYHYHSASDELQRLIKLRRITALPPTAQSRLTSQSSGNTASTKVPPGSCVPR